MLSNYLLSVLLLKNICAKFTLPLYEVELVLSVRKLEVIESKFKTTVQQLRIQADQDTNEQAQGASVPMSFLLNSHRQQILEKPLKLSEVLEQTMQSQFVNMLYVCLFAPFIHPDTPKAYEFPRSIPTSQQEQIPHADLVEHVLKYRRYMELK